MDNDLLPSIIPDTFPKPILTTEASNLSFTRRADIELFNCSLQMLINLYLNVRSVKGALEVHDRIMKMIPQRRDILGLEYGSAADKGTRAQVFEPVD